MYFTKRTNFQFLEHCIRATTKVVLDIAAKFVRMLLTFLFFCLSFYFWKALQLIV